jgi:predicted alpha-1,6-mannanase (GH76 family)
MSDGKKKVSRFKTVKQKVIYLPHELADKFEKYSSKNKITQSRLVCEGITMRMSGTEDPFNEGFNQGLNEAMRIVRETKGAKMMFPSGKSFGELVCDEIDRYIREKP